MLERFESPCLIFMHPAAWEIKRKKETPVYNCSPRLHTVAQDDATYIAIPLPFQDAPNKRSYRDRIPGTFAEPSSEKAGRDSGLLRAGDYRRAQKCFTPFYNKSRLSSIIPSKDGKCRSARLGKHLPLSAPISLPPRHQ